MKLFVSLLCLYLANTGIVFAQDNALHNADTQTLFIIKTKSLPVIDQIISAIEAGIPSQLVIREFDLQGKQELGGPIIRSIKAQIVDPEKVIVLTMGTPATQLAINNLDNMRIIYTMADSNKLKLNNHEDIYEVSDKSSIAEQVQILEDLLPNVENVGIIADIQKSSWIRNQINLAGKSSNLGIHLKTMKLFNIWIRTRRVSCSPSRTTASVSNQNIIH